MVEATRTTHCLDQTLDSKIFLTISRINTIQVSNMELLHSHTMLRQIQTKLAGKLISTATLEMQTAHTANSLKILIPNLFRKTFKVLHINILALNSSKMEVTLQT